MLIKISWGDPHKNAGELCDRAKSKMAAIKMHSFTSRLHIKVLFVSKYTFSLDPVPVGQSVVNECMKQHKSFDLHLYPPMHFYGGGGGGEGQVFSKIYLFVLVTYLVNL